MSESRIDKVRKLRRAALGRTGDLPLDLRWAILDRAEELSGRSLDSPAHVPELLTSYVEKVARHAYEVTQKDIDAMKAAGYSEDEIFEVTLCAAIGAGLARMELALDLLRKGKSPL